MNLDKEKLTKKIVDTIKPDEIIYAEYSSGGAMGNCGSSRIYALKDDGLHYYYASVSSKEKAKKKHIVWLWICCLDLLIKIS